MHLIEEQKEQAAVAAVDGVRPGMIVGLGTGSTAEFAVRETASRLRDGLLTGVLGIPTSGRTESLARELGIPLTTLDAHPVIDITIDGADEIDPEGNLIKGGGGALLREKVIAQASKWNVVIADASKLSPALGTRFRLPVEVLQFAVAAEQRFLESLGGPCMRRVTVNGTPFITDEGNFIIDAAFGPITEPMQLAAKLSARAGIVEHGLFIRLSDSILICGENGVTQRSGSRIRQAGPTMEAAG